MADIKLKLSNNGIGSENRIEIDGQDLTNTVSGLSFWQSVAGSPANLELDVFVTSCEVSMQDA